MAEKKIEMNIDNNHMKLMSIFTNMFTHIYHEIVMQAQREMTDDQISKLTLYIYCDRNFYKILMLF